VLPGVNTSVASVICTILSEREGWKLVVDLRAISLPFDDLLTPLVCPFSPLVWLSLFSMEGHMFSDCVCVDRLFGTAWSRSGVEEQRGRRVQAREIGSCGELRVS